MDDVERVRLAVGQRVQETESKNEVVDEITPEFIKKCLDRNELGDAEIYKRMLRGRFVYNKAMACWMVWVGHHWEIDKMDAAEAAVEVVATIYEEERRRLAWEKSVREAENKESGDIKELMKRLSKRIAALRSKTRRKNCLFFAHTSDDPLAIEGSEIDQKWWLLACNNCVVNLITGSPEPGRQEDLLLRACPLDYPEEGIDADVSLWEEALLEIFAGRQSLLDFFRQVCGYAIWGKVTQAVFIVMTGRGANGKSMIVKALSEIMGELAGTIRSESLMVQTAPVNASAASPENMALRGRRFVFASETPDGCKLNAAAVKAKTGNDPIPGRNLYDRHEVVFMPTHTLFMMTNFLPHASADDFGLWRRVFVIPFDVSFIIRDDPDQELDEDERDADPNLPDKLKDLYPNILGWMVRGCLEWQKNGCKLIQPAVVKEAGQKYRDDEDSVGDFIQECCVVGDGYHVSAAAVYDRFETWWKENVSNFVPKKKRFGQWFSARFEKRKVGTISYYGVGLREALDA